MAYLSSNKIKVFPSAYRVEETDPTSNLSTEGQLTSLAVAGYDKDTFVKEDNDNLIIYFQGYKFVAKKADIIELFPSNSNIYAKAKIYGRNTPDVPSELSYSPTLTRDNFSGTDFNPDESGQFKALEFSASSSSGFVQILEKVGDNWQIPASVKLLLKTEAVYNTEYDTDYPITKFFRTKNLINGSQDCEIEEGIDYAHAEGSTTYVGGHYAHAEGEDTQANGNASHAEGSQTIAQRAYSHAEGGQATAAGEFSHAEGLTTVAEGRSSHAEGWGTQATGDYSHAEGCNTSATVDYAHAEGYQTEAGGRYSHTEGMGTITNREASLAIGKYNDSTSGNYVFTIGGGTDGSHRANLLSVDEEGFIKCKKLVRTFTTSDFAAAHWFRQNTVCTITAHDTVDNPNKYFDVLFDYIIATNALELRCFMIDRESAPDFVLKDVNDIYGTTIEFKILVVDNGVDFSPVASYIQEID